MSVSRAGLLELGVCRCNANALLLLVSSVDDSPFLRIGFG